MLSKHSGDFLPFLSISQRQKDALPTGREFKPSSIPEIVILKERDRAWGDGSMVEVCTGFCRELKSGPQHPDVVVYDHL